MWAGLKILMMLCFNIFIRHLLIGGFLLLFFFFVVFSSCCTVEIYFLPGLQAACITSCV